MINSTKFIQVSKKIDQTEWRRFRKFLQSPYFNTNENLLKLADVIRKYHPTYDQKGCNKVNLFAKAFGKKGIYKEQKMGQMMSQLFQLVESFLLAEEFKNEETIEGKLRLKYYKERRLDNLFFKEAKK